MLERAQESGGRGGWHGPLYYSSTIVPPSGKGEGNHSCQKKSPEVSGRAGRSSVVLAKEGAFFATPVSPEVGCKGGAQLTSCHHTSQRVFHPPCPVTDHILPLTITISLLMSTQPFICWGHHLHTKGAETSPFHETIAIFLSLTSSSIWVEVPQPCHWLGHHQFITSPQGTMPALTWLQPEFIAADTDVTTSQSLHTALLEGTQTRKRHPRSKIRLLINIYKLGVT